MRLDLLENSHGILQLVGGRPSGRVAEDRLEGSERGLELCQLSDKGIGGGGNTRERSREDRRVDWEARERGKRWQGWQGGKAACVRNCTP